MPLGVILKNENVLNEMVEILDELHKYVPTKQTTQEFEVVHSEDNVEHLSLKADHFHHILLGGDQLSPGYAVVSEYGTILRMVEPASKDFFLL